MQRSILRKTMEIGGRSLTLETGRMAEQANGAVFASYGDTMVLVTATKSKKPREGMDFFPLTVDYEERFYAIGKIPGGFIKREGRPSEKSILSSRLIDRPIRPLFPKEYRNDVHVVATVLSVDKNNPPDILALVTAGAALEISDIPFGGPVAGVAIGRVDGHFVVNPTLEQKEKSEMYISLAGTKDAITMVEASAEEVSEEIVLEGILLGHDQIKEMVAFIENFRQEAEGLGLALEKEVFEAPSLGEDLAEEIVAKAQSPIRELVAKCAAEKIAKPERELLFSELKESLLAEYIETEEFALIIKKMDAIQKQEMRRLILKEKVRIDGRKLDEVRPITCEVGVLKRTHGSALFTRGQTQILNVSTLGAVGDEQIIDGLGEEESKRYMHHYNFPPFSVGETRPMRGPGRREIGHGALAEKALVPVIPREEEFPYTLRLVSEALSSNGSTSMGSVCGSTLSLMDAGVPIKAPVSGVAMGLIKEEDEFLVLTDIQGIEDALGDMDFKVAGTEFGVTAIQMDIKIAGIAREVFSQALDQAKAGRMHILGKMMEALDRPRPDISEYAPRIITTQVDPDKIRDIIGAGGKTIKKIVEETGAQIDIQDSGQVFIASTEREKGDQALDYIKAITAEVEKGKLYMGKVVKVADFGAFVEVIPGVLGTSGKEGLVHISQLAKERVNKVTDVVQEGDEILVKVIDIDNQGKVKLSKKAAMQDSEASK